MDSTFNIPHSTFHTLVTWSFPWRKNCHQISSSWQHTNQASLFVRCSRHPATSTFQAHHRTDAREDRKIFPVDSWDESATADRKKTSLQTCACARLRESFARHAQHDDQC